MVVIWHCSSFSTSEDAIHSTCFKIEIFSCYCFSTQLVVRGNSKWVKAIEGKISNEEKRGEKKRFICGNPYFSVRVNSRVYISIAQ